MNEKTQKMNYEMLNKVVQSRLDRRLLEVERELKRNREEKGSLFHLESNYPTVDRHHHHLQYEPQIEENQTKKIQLTHQSSTNLRECAKTIRENVMQYRDELMRTDVISTPRDEDFLLFVNRRQIDSLQAENEYLLQHQNILSRSTALNEMICFKNELEKSERQREQLSDRLETLTKTCDQKEKLLSKTSLELKEVNENCDTFERQNHKLQHDLTLALERLEQMSEQAEHFAQESMNSQKLLADSEQKREEYQIQSQESTKQWKARVQKLEKDIERYKLDSIHLAEKNEQLIKEIDNQKLQCVDLREQIMKFETDLNDSNISYNQLEEQYKRRETDVIQLQGICSSQQDEVGTLKGTVNELSSQISIQRQQLLQLDREQQDSQQRLQEQIDHRNHTDLKLKHYEKEIETANATRSQLQQQIHELESERKNFLQRIKELQFDKDLLSDEKVRLLSIETDYQQIKVQFFDEKLRVNTLQRYENEQRKEIERLQDKSNKFEDETIQKQHLIETLSREIQDKCRLITEIESKINKLVVEMNNQKNQMIKKDDDYQHSLQMIYNDIVHCTESLSINSSQPFRIEHAITPRDDMEVWTSKLKAHLAWMKQELEIHQDQERKLRQDLNNTLLDCEADRVYFASELAKREVLINKLTVDDYQRKSNEYIRSDLDIEYNKHRILAEDEREHIDDRYRQFRTLIDSVKHELQTAKIKLYFYMAVKPAAVKTFQTRPERRRGITDRPIRFRTFLQNTIYDVLRSRGWIESREDEEWDFYWCDVGSMKDLFDRGYFEEHMRINHFRNHYELTRKDLMVKNLKRYRKQVEREQGRSEALKCDFFPTTYVLPSEYHLFVEEFKKNPDTTWIMKPAARAQGKGIFLFRKLQDITAWRKGEYMTAYDKEQNREAVETYVVQRYLDNPYLIGGKKFDIRIYTLVTSYNPLRVWLYREGFARLSGTRYTSESIEDTYVHITNNAVQKTAPNYDPDKGYKWSMGRVRQYLTAKHGHDAVDVMFKQMDDIFIKSVQSVQKIMINDKHCFELYGYDILLDGNLKPWLIETNASPSLTASNQEDHEIKCRLLEDMLNVIDMEGRLTGKEKRIGGFDLIYNDGPVYCDETGVETFNLNTLRLNSFLGCANDRVVQLRHLYRQNQLIKRMEKAAAAAAAAN
ncbi:hypothetical protein I4U23_026848 [Adineta vaga]|nr:hypothetical protein I4U23_026848 [Adineta vaga]